MSSTLSRPRITPVKRVSGLTKMSLAQEMNVGNEYTMTQARFSEHRKKMGLSRISNMQEVPITGYDRKIDNMTIYVTEKFQRKECVRFVQDPKQKEKQKCFCGEIPEKHQHIASYVQEHFQATSNDKPAEAKPWSATEHITKLTTNGFGKIEFSNEGLGGRKPAKFVRVADDTSIEDIVELMLTHWHMAEPHPANLVITVIGGAKNFKLDGKKKEIFNRGLVNAAKTTHAWIITSGCNMGVMKAVGEAVQEGQSYNYTHLGMTHSLRCIGIAPWGYIEGNQALVSQTDKGCWNAQYRVNNVIRHGHPVSLNPDHTHFILVDDGFRGRYGGVADFRARLESNLKTRRIGDREGIPVVLVVVEGGTDAINDTKQSLSRHIPVVICEGTGRAADILAYAYRNYITSTKGQRNFSDKHIPGLKKKLIDAYGETWEKKNKLDEEVRNFTTMVLECCQNEKLITVFDMNRHEDLDLAILSALLKSEGATNTTQLHDQLKLALTWNRSDIAEEKIFTDSIQWPPGSLDDVMTTALLEDKVDFVRLLLQNGVVMREYLTVERLRSLYNSAPKTSHLKQLLQGLNTRAKTFCLRDVGRLIHELMGKHDDEIYQNDTGDDEDDIHTSTHTSMRLRNKHDKTLSFPKPFREMFFWAVLMNRQELAKFLWERGDEGIPSAIVASHLNKALAERVPHFDSATKQNYQANKDDFEKLAVNLADECHQIDPEKAAMLVERKYKTWGDANCLEMAAAAEDKEFLSTVCCQNILDMMWNRGLASPWYKVLLGIVFPPFIWCIVQFDLLGENEHLSKELSPWKKMVVFYRAPVTKFAANVMMYVVFLGLYSYMILFDFRPEPTVLEFILIAWIFTLLVEEIREMFSSKSDGVFAKIRDWWGFSAFNRIDMAVILLGMIGLSLRFRTDLFIYAKSVYALNCVFLFIRVLRDYSASSYFGPKLVMIKLMLMELVLYIAILLVFLLAYGISIQSLMFPIREPYWLIFKDIFYYPYWQIYGELYLDELEGRTDDCLNNSTVKDDGTPCPSFHPFVPAFTAAYLLIGNVLLLNLLIAIFTHIFDEVEKNSIQIWKFGMYFLVVEYDSKPGLTPPFIIFEHIFLVLKWLCRKTCCQKKSKGPILTDSQIYTLEVFEKEACKSLIQKEKWGGRDDLHKRINFIQHRVDEMAKMLEEERLNYEEENQLSQGLLDVPRGSPRRRRSLNADGDGRSRSRSRSPVAKPVICLNDTLMSSMNDTMTQNEMNIDNTARQDTKSSEKFKPKSVDDMYERKPEVNQRDPNTWDARKTAWQPETEATNTEWRPRKSRSRHDSSSDEEMVKSKSKKKQKGKVRKAVSPSSSSSESEEVHYRQSRRKSKGHKEKKRLNIDETDSSGSQRMEVMEAKLASLEESTSLSLYNIEALLRNTVFQRGTTAGGTGGTTRSSMRQSRRSRKSPEYPSYDRYGSDL